MIELVNKHLLYISVVTELVSIFFSIITLNKITPSFSFTIILAIYDCIYSIYMIAIVLCDKTSCSKYCDVILILSALRILVYDNNPIACIIDSIICIILLICYYRKCFLAKSNKIS